MDRETVAATRIGGHAHRYLSEAHRVGRVASRFRNGIQLRFGTEGAPVFLALQTPEIPLHPWSLELPSLPELPEGMHLKTTSEGLQSRRGAAVDLSSVRVDDLEVLPLSPHQASAARRQLIALQRLVERARVAMPKDPLERRIDAILQHGQTPGDASLLSQLVGLGRGSTPGGDDVLVGLCTGLRILSEERPEAHEALCALRRALNSLNLSKRTHPASGQMVAAAAEGSLPEPLRDLSRALAGGESGIEELTTAVLALGATSGLYMLYGLTSALGSTEASINPVESPTSAFSQQTGQG